MEVDNLSATDIAETQTTVSSRDNEEQERLEQEVVTEPEELAQYKWREEFEDDLRDMATKGTMSPEWPILANIIKSRLVHNTHAFLTKTPRKKYQPLPDPGPQRAPLLPATSVDSFAIDDVPLETLRAVPATTNDSSPEDKPSTPGGLVIPPFPPRVSSRGRQRVGAHQRSGGDVVEMNDEAVIGGRTLKSEMTQDEAWGFLKGLIKLLDEFTTAPPFTIQRLCELAWKPFQQHTSIGKYLRAIEKNLLVTTTHQPDTEEAENGTPTTGGGFPGMTNGIRSRASSVSSSSSTSSQNAPLFSPIPFLVERRVINPDGTPITSPATLPGFSGTSEVDAPVSSLSIDVHASTRDVGDVTMGDSQGDRPGTPMHDGNQQFYADQQKDTATAPLNHLALATSGVAALAQNGTNGSSSTIDGKPDTAHEPFTGRVDELDAGPLLQQPSPASASDPHQLHLPPPDEDTSTRHQEGTGERGTMTPHAMADRPQAISSTTDLSAATNGGSPFSQKPMDPPVGGTRTIRAMPRTTSVAGSLNERFVSGEVLEANIPKEEGVEGETGNGHVVEESPAKAAKLS